MRGIIATVIVASSLAGCVTASPPPPPTTPYPLSPAEMAIIEEGVRSGLKDPASAMFGGAVAAKGGSTIYVCGKVNAKNSFGGYTGDQWYFGMMSDTIPRFLVAGFGGTDAKDFAVLKMCKDYGIADRPVAAAADGLPTLR